MGGKKFLRMKFSDLAEKESVVFVSNDFISELLLSKLVLIIDWRRREEALALK